MKVRDLAPSWATLPTEHLLKSVSSQTLHAKMMECAEWYADHLPMWQVLRFYGTDVHPNDDMVTVSCQLLSHGGTDVNASARYFGTDRETGARRGAVYCYKCQKSLTSFWYVYRMQKDKFESHLADVFLFIENTFGVPFPRDIILDFDPDTFYSFEDDGNGKEAQSSKFHRARGLRDELATDPAALLAAAFAMLTESANA